MPTKLKLLVTAHAFLAILPVAAPMLPNDVQSIPLMWAVFGIVYAQVMLLAIWLGLGTKPLTARLFSTTVGAAYCISWLYFGITAGGMIGPS
jgi:hypothetical protein